MSLDAMNGEERSAERASRLGEMVMFAILAILIWPIVAVGVVGGYGFAVWMWQLAFGPPGPPG